MQIKKMNDISTVMMIFAVGFLVGCIYFNFLWKIGDVFSVNERKYVFGLLQEEETYRKFWKMILMILGSLIYVFSVSSCFTDFGAVLSNGLWFVQSIWWGAFFTECTLIKGVSSVWYTLKFVLPEGVFFMAAYILCLIWANNMSTSVKNKGKYKRKNAVKHRKILIISVCFFVFWIICSCYVNQFTVVKFLGKIF